MILHQLPKSLKIQLMPVLQKLWKLDLGLLRGQMRMFSVIHPTRLFLSYRQASLFLLLLIHQSITFTGSAWAEDSSTELPFANAKWIAPPQVISENQPLPLFRKEFQLPGEVETAKLAVIGLGDYDLWINGERLAETGINQPWSEYDKTIYYREFDVIKLLAEGSNCVGIMLTNSFWNNQPAPDGRYFKSGPQRTAEEPHLAIAALEIKFRDGTTQRLETDESWKVSAGPISFSHIFAGEDFDARRVPVGWNKPEFNDSAWQPARVVASPTARLRKQFWPAIREVGRFLPTSVKEASPGIWLCTFPQNTAAQLRVCIRGGSPGNQVTFKCGEHKNNQDRLFGHYIVECNLITADKNLVNQWSSFYVGMQFIEMQGAVPQGEPNPDKLPVIESIEILPVRTGFPERGSFECSSETLNAAYRLIDSAMQSNASHVITDCPHREKLGWLEVPYLMGPSFQYRYDCQDWLQKVVGDIRDSQEADGKVRTVAPSYPAGKFPDKFDFTVEWGAAAVLLPWHLYEWSGDQQHLRENLDMMRRFTDYIGVQANDGLAPGGLGDWYDYGHGQPPGESRYTPTRLSATATWAMCSAAVANAANVLGENEMSATYRLLHSQIAEDFQAHFRHPNSGLLKHRGSPQCSNAMAICAQVVPAEDHKLLIDDIVSDLQTRDWQQTPGDIGHVHFIRALAEAGRSDVLHKVYARNGTGSYGGIAAKGLTTLPETWDAMMDGYQSLNHCMLGHAMEWFYGYVAGIRQQPGSVGWKKILIAPSIGNLSHAKATFASPAGEISSSWTVRNNQFKLEATVPKGVEAVAVFPSGKTIRLRSGTQRLSEDLPAGL
jgi:hypothetical protein